MELAWRETSTLKKRMELAAIVMGSMHEHINATEVASLNFKA